MRTQGGAGSRAQGRSSTPKASGQADAWRLTVVERRTVRVCIGIALLLIIGLVFLFFIRPETAGPLAIFMAANLIVGREVSITIGTALGLPPWLLLGVNLAQSVSTGLLIYLGAVHVLGAKPQSLLGRGARKMRERARRHGRTIDRLGPPGLFLLMLLPFFAHPFIGAMAGRLSGLDFRQMIVPVVASTFVVAAVWAYSMSAIFNLLHDAWGGFAFVIVAVVAIMVALVTVVMMRKRRRQANGAGNSVGTKSRA